MTDIDREGDLLAGVEEGTTAETDASPHRLIASDRVEGTAVYSRDGEKIGTVKRFFVEKTTGQARYAEMEFGGFLGLGADTHPLPWEVLDYDADKGGYVVSVTKEQLYGAPRYAETDHRAIDDYYESQIRGHYGLGMF